MPNPRPKTPLSTAISQAEVCTKANPAHDAAISAWETDGARMSDVEVCVNNLAQQRGGRVYVPSEGASEFSIALTPALALVLDVARSPIRYSTLADKLAAEFPTTGGHHRAKMLARLLQVRLLRSSLRAPATVADPTVPLPLALREDTQTHSTAPDLRLDAMVRLPNTVLTEAETAATVLTRLAMHPAGTPAWRRYIEQFADRYGENTEVALDLLTDPEQGLGFPEGCGHISEPPRPMTRRDRLLLELAGTDKTYAEWGAAAVAALREAGATYVILAGKPGENTVDGVDDSCAMGVDALAFLTRVREELGK